MAVDRRKWPAAALGLTVLTALLVGCGPKRLQRVRDAYARSDFAAAYEQGAAMAEKGTGPATDEAAFLAGMAAYQMQDHQNALRFLNIAHASADPSVAGKAMAQSGIIYYEQGRSEQAARQLLAAAARLEGEDQALAWLMAAKAQQKLGRWEQARQSLAQSRARSADLRLLDHANQRLRLSGYTIQVGAFAEAANARRAAKGLSARTSRLGLGRPKLVSAVDASGRKLVLVQVGRFNDEAAAASARRMLGSSGDVVPIVSP